MDAININLLAHPTPNIKVMELSRWKVGQLIKMLMTRELWTPDEWRTIPRCHLLLSMLFPPNTIPQEVRSINLAYELADWAGMIAFTSIIPGYKADVMLKYWDKKQFNHKLYREMKQLVDIVMEELNLIRLSCVTADKKMRDLAVKYFGFKVEGRFAKGFRWDGKLYTEYRLRRLREE